LACSNNRRRPDSQATPRRWRPRGSFGEWFVSASLSVPGARTTGVEPIVIPGGHCPHASRPETLADVLHRTQRRRRPGYGQIRPARDFIQQAKSLDCRGMDGSSPKTICFKLHLIGVADVGACASVSSARHHKYREERRGDGEGRDLALQSWSLLTRMLQHNSRCRGGRQGHDSSEPPGSVGLSFHDSHHRAILN
jgi:hypothetical protein